MKNQKNIVFTNRSANSINILGKDIRKYKVLESEEEKDLLERVAMGDKRARDLLINSNLRLVMSRAKQYARSGMAQEDIFQVGTIGLIQAVDKYDPTKGDCFVAYALYWIEGELLKAVKEHTRNTPKTSLDDMAFASEDCKLTLLDVLDSGYQNHADWNVGCESAINTIKAMVKKAFFADAANLWVDYFLMKEKGYTLSDVTKKHHVSEEQAKEKIKKINQWLSKRYLS